jgi:hypothetical protein
VGVNDDVGLEREADLMGGRAVQMQMKGAQKVRTDSVAPRDNALAVQLSPIIQFVMEGSKFTFKSLEPAVTEHGYHSWKDCNFIAYVNKNELVNNVHLHLYGLKSEANKVSFNGHAIWKKNPICSMKFSITANLAGNRWGVQLIEGDSEIGEENANPDLKNDLLEILGKLPDIVGLTLNEDIENVENEDIDS